MLSVLYASGLFPLLFLAAYLLPGGVAAVINSLSPLLVVVLSVPLLGARIQAVQVFAGFLGVAGVAMLVLRSDARLDPIGLLAMTGAATMMGVATVLTKRWGRPPGMSSLGMTGWTFLLAGLTLLPITLIVEGLPRELTARNIGGLVYLVLISGILAYALWFWGLQYLTASAVTFLIAAQSRGRRRARLGGARPAAQRAAAARRADRADLGGARSARRVRAAAPRSPTAIAVSIGACERRPIPTGAGRGRCTRSAPSPIPASPSPTSGPSWPGSVPRWASWPRGWRSPRWPGWPAR